MRCGPPGPAATARPGSTSMPTGSSSNPGLKDGLPLTKSASLLYRHTGVVVPYRTFHRYCVAELGYRPGRATTVRVDDPEPGSEVQIDFGKMGLLFDAATARRRFVYALIFTAAYSRHLFVFLTFSQT